MPLFSRFLGASEGVHIQEVTGSSPVVPTKKAEVCHLGFLLSATVLRAEYTQDGEPRQIQVENPSAHAMENPVLRDGRIPAESRERDS